MGVYQTNPPSDVAYLLNHSRSVLHFAEDQEQVDKAVAIAGSDNMSVNFGAATNSLGLAVEIHAKP